MDALYLFMHNIMQPHNQLLDYEFQWGKSRHNWD